MLTKDDLLDAILLECDIALHLASKIPDGGLDHRPAPGQRSTLELLRYMSFCAMGAAIYLRTGNWDGYQTWHDKTKDLGIDQIPAAMEEQKTALRAYFAELTDEELQREAALPTGVTTSVARGLLAMSHNWMVGYKMQLFLYVKAAGNDEIWTPDCWAGISMPRDTQPAGA
jgi:hypothetical protein